MKKLEKDLLRMFLYLYFFTNFSELALISPFIPNALFLYPLTTSKNLTVFWCYQGAEEGYIGNKWVEFNLLKEDGCKVQVAPIASASSMASFSTTLLDDISKGGHPNWLIWDKTVAASFSSIDIFSYFLYTRLSKGF